MKLNVKKSLLSIFSTSNGEKKSRDYALSEDLQPASSSFGGKYEEAFENYAIPDLLLDKITEIINKTIPDVILSTIDKDAEKKEINEYLKQSFVEYIDFVTNKIKSEDNKAFASITEKSSNHNAKLEEELNLALQREEKYKERTLSAERQKRALNDKIAEIEQRLEKLTEENDSLNSARIENNNRCRLLERQKNIAEEESNNLRLELEHIKQIEENAPLLNIDGAAFSGEYVDSLKKEIIKLQVQNGELEDKFNLSEERAKDITKSLERALHAKDDAVKQAVERESSLQSKISLLQKNSEEEPQQDDSAQRLIDVTRKYQALQSELVEYKNKIYEDVVGGMQRKIDALTTKLKDTPKEVSEDITLAENKELKEKLIEAEVTEKNLENEVAAATSKIEKLQNKIDKLSVAVESKKTVKQLNELKNKLASAEKETEKYRRDCEVSIRNVKALTNEVESLKSEIRSYKGTDLETIDDWMVVMEPETEKEIIERKSRMEMEIKESEEKEKQPIFEDPAQMKLW